MILVDTNVLGQLCHATDPLRPFSLNALRVFRRQGQRLVIVPQTLYEFWVTATRPAAVNGLEMPFERAMRWFNHFQNAFVVLSDPPELLDVWQGLLIAHRTVGKRAHDGRLVAAMQLHGIASILTFNIRDFEKYPIQVIDPRTL
jgi:predicted nucleic acid-binding protein